MRQERTVEATIFEVFAGHQIGCDLKTISRARRDHFWHHVNHQEVRQITR